MANRLRNGRVQTAEFNAVKAIQPAALPGSTFVEAPRNDGGSKNLYALADALGGLSSSLGAWNRRRQADKAASYASAKSDQKEYAQQIDESWSPDDLKRTAADGTNPYAARQAQVILGKKEGADQRGVLDESYKEYDPQSDGPLETYLTRKATEYLDQTTPVDGPDNANYRRNGAWTVMKPYIGELINKEQQFVTKAGKESLEQGFAAEATSVIQAGKTQGLPAKIVAQDLLRSWASVRKASRENPEFMGADADSQFRKAVEGLAEAGETELVKEILSQNVEGRPAALIDFAPEKKWAEETLTKAEKQRIQINADTSVNTLTQAEVEADKGEFTDARRDFLLNTKVISPADAIRLGTKSKIAESARIEKAQAERLKDQTRLAHDDAIRSADVANLSVMMTEGGGRALLREKEIPSEDGKGTKVLSVEDQAKGAEELFWRSHDKVVDALKASDPQAAAELSLNKQIEFFGNNADFKNKRWDAMFASAVNGSSVEALTAAEDGKAPTVMMEAADLYTRLWQKNTNIAASYAKDERTRAILESYRIAKTEAAAYSGGGSFTPDQALAVMTGTARRIANDPEVMKGIRWDDKLRKKIDTSVQNVGNGWVFGGAATLNPEAATEIRKQADFLFKAGITDPDKAIEEATAQVTKEYIQLENGSLVNARGVVDKEDFSAFASEFLDNQFRLAKGGPSDPAATAENYRLIRMNGRWQVFGDRGPLLDKDGKIMSVGPEDMATWQRLKEERTVYTILKKDEIRQARNESELYGNYLKKVGGSQYGTQSKRNALVDALTKVKKDSERAAIWERERLSREGTNTRDFIQQLSDKMATFGPMMRKDIVARSLKDQAPTVYTSLMDAVVWRESRGDATAVSSTGNHFGLMQLGWDTAAVDAAKDLGITEYLEASKEERINMLMDPNTNRKLGEHYLNSMLTKYENVEYALVAYNWGMGNANKWIKAGAKFNDLPKETQGYLSEIMPKVDKALPPTMDLSPQPSVDYKGKTLGAYTGKNDVLLGTQPGRQPVDMSGLKPEVVDKWKQVQDAFGGQVPIVSAFRDPKRNAKSGGAKHSQHMHGNAIDVDVSRISKKDRLRLIETASEAGFTGIGIYNNSLHFDTGNRRVWGPSYGRNSVPGWAYTTVVRHLGRA
jgi:hypothetical protein